MPFSNYKQFDSDALVVMSAAYDAAIAKLGIAVSDPRTGKVANQIITLFAEGNHDAGSICEKTCAALIK
jgi:hypothetical protein